MLLQLLLLLCAQVAACYGDDVPESIVLNLLLLRQAIACTPNELRQAVNFTCGWRCSLVVHATCIDGIAEACR